MGIGDVFVFHAIWVRLDLDFNLYAFEHYVTFLGKKVTAHPPLFQRCQYANGTDMGPLFRIHCSHTTTITVTFSPIPRFSSLIWRKVLKFEPDKKIYRVKVSKETVVLRQWE